MMTKVIYVEQELKNSVMVLSSDSELCPDSSPVRENQLQHGEFSDQRTSRLSCRGLGEDAVHIGSNEDSPSKKASKVNSPKKDLEADDQTVMKEKKKKSSMKKEGIE